MFKKHGHDHIREKHSGSTLSSMGLLQKIRDIVKPAPDDLVITWDEAADRVHEREGETIEATRTRAKELMETTQQLMDDLDTGIDDIKSYSDAKSREQIEDIAQSFAQARQRQIDQVSFSMEDIEYHHDDLTAFISDFTDVTQKQGAVFQQIKADSQEFGQALQSLIDHAETIEDFIDTEYQYIEAEERINDLQSEIQDRMDEIDDLRTAIDEEKVRELETNRDELDAEIEDLKASDAWEHKQSLDEAIESMKTERSEKQNKLASNVRKLERGLKKLIYDVEHGNLAIDADIRVFRTLRDGEYMAVEDPYDDLKEAQAVIEEHDILSERKTTTFAEAVEALESYPQIKDDIEDLDASIESKQRERDGLDVLDELDELEQKRRKLQNKIERLRERNQERRDSISQKEGEIEQFKQQLEDELDDLLRANVTVE